MKLKLTIAIVLVVGTINVFGQGKWTINPDTTSNRFVFLDANKSDTTECWFKEVIINKGKIDTAVTNGIHNLNNAVQEYWQHGYIVRFPYRSIALISVASYRHPDNEYFLYANKKRVTNPVIAIVEK